MAGKVIPLRKGGGGKDRGRFAGSVGSGSRGVSSIPPTLKEALEKVTPEEGKVLRPNFSRVAAADPTDDSYSDDEMRFHIRHVLTRANIEWDAHPGGREAGFRAFVAAGSTSAVTNEEIQRLVELAKSAAALGDEEREGRFLAQAAVSYVGQTIAECGARRDMIENGHGDPYLAEDRGTRDVLENAVCRDTQVLEAGGSIMDTELFAAVFLDFADPRVSQDLGGRRDFRVAHLIQLEGPRGS